MSPLAYQCVNFPDCPNPVLAYGEMCPECKQRAKQAKANEWKYKGWSRLDERLQPKHHGKKDKEQK